MNISKSNKILILDEDYQTMYLLKNHLEEHFGYVVKLSAQMDLFEHLKHDHYDMIILDIMIKPKSIDLNNEEVENIHYDNVNWKKTGLEFLRRLRKGEYQNKSGEGTLPNVPVILLSAIADNSFMDESLPGTDDYIEKPFRMESLVNKIQNILEG